MSMSLKVSFLALATVLALMFTAGFDMHEQAALDTAGTPQAPTTTTTPATTLPASSTTTTTVPPIVFPPAPAGAKCPQWWDLAQHAGWTYEQLETALDLIMWRESRCLPEVRSKTSDTGLLQINDIHLPMLEAAGISPDMLTDPLWNLISGRLVADQAESYGWHWAKPWLATFP
jgi:soluble lytic murein transglycosylase-like protein